MVLGLLAAVVAAGLAGVAAYWVARRHRPSTIYAMVPPGGFLYQVNCGAHNDQPFSRSHGYFKGRKVRSSVDPQKLQRVGLAHRQAYLTDHRGKEFSYLFQVPRGWFQVELHFVELVFKGRGRRQFDIHIKGNPVARGFDILAQTAPRHGLVRRWAVWADDGKLDLLFIGRKDEAKVNFIRIRPMESATPMPHVRRKHGAPKRPARQTPLPASRPTADPAAPAMDPAETITDDPAKTITDDPAKTETDD